MAMQPSHLYAIIDMGSNGIRFSITDLSQPTARMLPTIFNDRVGISLYEAQFSSPDGTRGPIPQDVMDQVGNRFVRFQVTCKDFGVPQGNIHVLATEATRTAPNSDEFCSYLKARTGWDVTLLSKEEEGRIGALGIASSASSVAGLAMDLGGGSTQFTWVIEEDGVVQTSPQGSFSFPYGAAALTRRLEQGGGKKKAERALREEMTQRFRDAYPQLNVPASLFETAKRKKRLDLYLCGGGFRGWGYVLMKQCHIDPYPIPIINGFQACRTDFHDTVSVLDVVTSSDAKVFGVSKRRAAHIPAVAILVDAIMDALPAITHIQFCQGGVREGFLFDRLPRQIRAQDPLCAATLPYASPSADVLRELLSSTLPTSPSPIAGHTAPKSFSPQLLAAIANLLFAHSRGSRKETRKAAALRCTTSGILASANSLSHTERAIIALVLCERWDGDLSPADLSYQLQLAQTLSPQEAYWCRFMGHIANLIGEVYPAGRVTRWRIQFETGWEEIVKKKEQCDLLHLRVRCNQDDVGAITMQDSLQEWTHAVEKTGKKKNWVRQYGIRVGVTIW
ncbi:Ppx/GppA phosphatase family-domain-containing protein [Aspergillus ambiguus]|uniref:retrograde regulation protein 2 n=1 Tax=Aspergillus ambiguus TaxID=176160 RepID=UPI003CCD917C